MSALPVLRKHYKQRAAVTAFYMGGPVDIGSDGECSAMTRLCVFGSLMFCFSHYWQF
jgi:hypothetical protein